jgi:hypothetical protein
MSVGDGIGFAALCLAVAAYAVLKHWRGWFCSHEWESLGDVRKFEGTKKSENDLPTELSRTYRCTKCGKSNKIEL